MIYSNNFVIRNIQNTLYNQNGNWICIIVGKPRTCKTWTAISFAEQINPEFKWKNTGFLSMLKFLEFLQKREFIVDKGTIFILDDFGTQYSSREWQSQESIIYSKIFQIFGFLNSGLIITVPSLSMIDKDARILAHNLIVTSKYTLDIKNSETIVKMYELSHNDLTRKTYSYFPKYVDKDGFTTLIKSFRFPRPSIENTEIYEEDEKSLKRQFLDGAVNDLKAIKKQEDEKSQGRRHRHTWYPRLEKNDWRCVHCGETTKENPF